MALLQKTAGPALLAICGAAIFLQVMIRPAIGIANNGDFAKMAGTVALGPEDGTWTSRQNYSEFLYRYARADRYAYNRDFRTAAFLSSEFFFVKLARGLQKILHSGPRFDIRWLGATNGTVFLLAIAVWIYAIPARWRLAAGLPLIVIWTDAAYVQYLNSFYMDTAAMIFLVLCVAAALHSVANHGGRLYPFLSSFAGVMFAASKAQHGIPGLIIAAVFIWFALRSRDIPARAIWAAGSVLVVAGACTVYRRVTGEYRSTPLFNTVFDRLAPDAPDPLHALEELGLARDDLPYLHTNAYSPGSPISDPNWLRRFQMRCTYGRVLGYYLRHPASTAHYLYAALSGPAAHIRPWANLSIDDGFHPGARTTRFTYWTDIRCLLLKYVPWHVLFLYLVAAAAAVSVVARVPAERDFAGLVLAILAIATAEYAIAVLADAAETDRHLIIFHVATELTILLLPAILWKACTGFRAARRPARALSVRQ